MNAVVTHDDIVSGVKKLGVRAGDTVFVHSSLSSFGRVEDGSRTVVQALLDLVGSGGTLIVPIFRSFFTEGPDQFWDRDSSPSLMGRISETVRTWPGARRSRHAPHPIAAIGALAEELAESDNQSDFSFDSPFARLLETNSWILFIGVTMNRCTMVHLLEERAGVPYRHWVIRTGIVSENGTCVRKSYPFFERYAGVGNDFIPLGKRMDAEGLLSRTEIGQSVVLSLRSRDLYAVGMKALIEDPLFLVNEEGKETARMHLPRNGETLHALVRRPRRIHTTKDKISGDLSRQLWIPQGHESLRAEVVRKCEGRDELEFEEVRVSRGSRDCIPGMLALPRRMKGPVPAVICLHGEGGCWEELMEERLTMIPGVPRLGGWARALARRGFTTLAITQFGFPPRPESWDGELRNMLSLHAPAVLGQLVSDALRCVEFLRIRPEVDRQRICIGGFSMGGLVSLFSFTVSRSIAATFVLSPETAQICRHACPRVRLEPSLLARSFAPRPLFLWSGMHESGAPGRDLPGLDLSKMVDAARSAYATCGAVDNFQIMACDAADMRSPSSFLHMHAFEEASIFLCRSLGAGKTESA